MLKREEQEKEKRNENLLPADSRSGESKVHRKTVKSSETISIEQSPIPQSLHLRAERHAYARPLMSLHV